MNNKITIQVIMITLQATAVGLLCYLSLVAPRPAIWLLVLGDSTKPDAGIMMNGGDGLRADDVRRITRQVESERKKDITAFHKRYTSDVLQTSPIAVKVETLPKHLNSALQRYELMSDEEKRELEEKLANHLWKSEGLESALGRAREAIRHAASRPTREHRDR